MHRLPLLMALFALGCSNEVRTSTKTPSTINPEIKRSKDIPTRDGIKMRVWTADGRQFDWCVFVIRQRGGGVTVEGGYRDAKGKLSITWSKDYGTTPVGQDQMAHRFQKCKDDVLRGNTSQLALDEITRAFKDIRRDVKDVKRGLSDLERARLERPVELVRAEPARAESAPVVKAATVQVEPAVRAQPVRTPVESGAGVESTTTIIENGAGFRRTTIIEDNRRTGDHSELVIEDNLKAWAAAELASG